MQPTMHIIVIFTIFLIQQKTGFTCRGALIDGVWIVLMILAPGWRLLDNTETGGGCLAPVAVICATRFCGMGWVGNCTILAVA